MLYVALNVAPEVRSRDIATVEYESTDDVRVCTITVSTSTCSQVPAEEAALATAGLRVTVIVLPAKPNAAVIF